LTVVPVARIVVIAVHPGGALVLGGPPVAVGVAAVVVSMTADVDVTLGGHLDALPVAGDVHAVFGDVRVDPGEAVALRLPIEAFDDLVRLVAMSRYPDPTVFIDLGQVVGQRRSRANPWGRH
jgi:hypothetical protein